MTIITANKLNNATSLPNIHTSLENCYHLATVTLHANKSFATENTTWECCRHCADAIGRGAVSRRPLSLGMHGHAIGVCLKHIMVSEQA